MDVIRLLPDSVANQIAAGEVVQRPANVVKELVENSIDAGATEILVHITDAGRTAIQVIDNGKGMSVTDARMAFERHATSKIQQAEDLFSLHTMGFRGEALPSIAAVSMVDCRTCRAEDNGVGTQLIIEGSRVKKQVPCSMSVGCNIKVENIFFNTPARRKFLKSNTTEMNNIITAFERIVLVYPEVEFVLTSNGEELYHLRKGNTHQRIAEVFGKRTSQNILSVDVKTSLCSVTGFVGKPEIAKKKTTQQYFFVNGRYMKHPYFQRAVLTAYERLLPAGLTVPFWIYLSVEPDTIDVNIHPAKTEIKFENEQAIWQILSAAVRESVGLFSELPQLDFESTNQPEIPVFNPNLAVQNFESKPTNYNPFESAPKKQAVDYSLVAPPQLDLPIPAEEAPGEYIQVGGQYLASAHPNGLLLVDQHRAHVCILYKRYIARVRERRPAAQRLLFPEAVKIESVNAHSVELVLGQLEQLGFELTPLGANNYAISSVPTGIEGLNPSTLVHDLVSDTVLAGSTTVEEINHSLALSLARKAAIPRGQILSAEERKTLMADLMAIGLPNYTPNGKKVHFLLSERDLEQEFG